MTTDHHPITPPDELVWKWHLEWWQLKVKYIGINEYMATQAARWGADQQLNADCEWVQSYAECGDSLLAAMRPKSPSLAEEALDALNEIEDKMLGPTIQENLIRAALERLQELEQSND